MRQCMCGRDCAVVYRCLAVNVSVRQYPVTLLVCKVAAYVQVLSQLALNASLHHLCTLLLSL